ncbi:MAG: RNA polymerase sigma factor, partial [Planctomycetota bacterium]
MKGIWNDERDPLTALQAGRTDLFEAFVETETPTFLAFFRRLGATPGEAEDLTQDTFLKLYEHASRYRASDRFVPFARRVARNAWIDRRRRRTLRGVGRTDEEEGGWADRVEASEVEPLKKLEQLDEAQRISLALDSLSDLHRAVFELGVLQELPYTEIAAEMNIPDHHNVKGAHRDREGHTNEQNERGAGINVVHPGTSWNKRLTARTQGGGRMNPTPIPSQRAYTASVIAGGSSGHVEGSALKILR